MYMMEMDKYVRKCTTTCKDLAYNLLDCIQDIWNKKQNENYGENQGYKIIYTINDVDDENNNNEKKENKEEENKEEENKEEENKEEEKKEKEEEKKDKITIDNTDTNISMDIFDTFSNLANNRHCEICGTFNIKSVEICKNCNIHIDIAPIIKDILEELYSKVDEIQNSTENKEDGLDLSISPNTMILHNILDIATNSSINNINKSDIEKRSNQSINLEEWEYIREESYKNK